MKSKKNVLVSLSVFIVVVFVITLFGQQPQKGPLWGAINELRSMISALNRDVDTLSSTVSTLQTQLQDANSNINDHESRIALLEERVVKLRADQSEIMRLLNTHTHDYSELTGDVPSHIHDISDISGAIDADTLQGSDASAFAPSAHNHDYSDISNPPTIPTEAEIIGLINENALGAPDYDSWWVPIDQAESLTLYHNLGGDHGDYLVDLQFWSDGSGYNIHSYGEEIMYYEGAYYYFGAFWDKLNNQSIRVRRGNSDIFAEWIRVRIWKYK